jgi:hypothetical protein
MNQTEINERIKVLKTIEEDMRRDAKELDGQPFNGRVVAQQFGYHGAAIAALARNLYKLLEEKEPTDE